MNWITDRQKLVYEYYKEHSIDEKQPTYSQASKDLWLVPSVVYSHICNLEKKWYIRRDAQGWIHIVEWKLDEKIIIIAQDMRPWIKLPLMWKSRGEWVDLLRCAILKKKEENEMIEKIIDSF